MEDLVLIKISDLTKIIREEINSALDGRIVTEDIRKPLSKDEVKKILHVEDRTLAKYRKRGFIKAKKIGREYVYDRKSVYSFGEI